MIRSSIGFTRKEVVAENGVVAGGHDLVAQTGVKIMQQGGNAVDGGVAAAFVAQLAEPGMCGVGGNGIICVHCADRGETTIFDNTTVPPKVAHLAHAFNLPVAPHAYQLIHLHLACATPNLKVVEYLGMAEASDRIVYKEWSEPKDGVWSPDPNKPGLGLELDPEAVEKYTAGADAPRTQL